MQSLMHPGGKLVVKQSFFTTGLTVYQGKLQYTVHTVPRASRITDCVMLLVVTQVYNSVPYKGMNQVYKRVENRY